MHERWFVVWFGILGGSTIVWLFMAASMFRQLRERHPEAYERLGKPSLLNSTIENNTLSAEFILRAQYRELGDPMISQLGNRMRFFFALYTLWFFGGLIASLLRF